MIADCPFCPPKVQELKITIENELCLFIEQEHPILEGSGMIIPKAHSETPFELTTEEITATFNLLKEVKEILDETLQPDGYNLGWNCGAVAGQEVFHAHLHVIPRFGDEPYAGKGIRYWLKQDSNRRG